MSRYRKKRSSSGGSSRALGGGIAQPIIGVILGIVLMIANLIIFQIAIGQLDAAVTTANTYQSEMPGVGDIMPIWGMLLFVILIGTCIAFLVTGSWAMIKQKVSGSFTDLLMLVIMGGVVIVVALVGNGLALTQLHTAIQAANDTVNTMTGAVDIMGIFGMVIFIAFMVPGIAMIGAAGYGGYRKLRGI